MRKFLVKLREKQNKQRNDYLNTELPALFADPVGNSQLIDTIKNATVILHFLDLLPPGNPDSVPDGCGVTYDPFPGFQPSEYDNLDNLLQDLLNGLIEELN